MIRPIRQDDLNRLFSRMWLNGRQVALCTARVRGQRCGAEATHVRVTERMSRSEIKEVLSARCADCAAKHPTEVK